VKVLGFLALTLVCAFSFLYGYAFLLLLIGLGFAAGAMTFYDRGVRDGAHDVLSELRSRQS